MLPWGLWKSIKRLMDAPFQLGHTQYYAQQSLTTPHPISDTQIHTHRHFQVNTYKHTAPHFSPPMVTGTERWLFAWAEQNWLSIPFPFMVWVCITKQLAYNRVQERIFPQLFSWKVQQPCPLRARSLSASLSVSTLQNLSRPDPPGPPPYPKTIRWGPLLPQTWRNMCFIFRAHSLGPR